MFITVDKVSHGALSTFIWRDETIFANWLFQMNTKFYTHSAKMNWRMRKIDSQRQNGKYYELRFSFARIHLIRNMLRRVLQSSFHWMSTCNSFSLRNDEDCDFLKGISVNPIGADEHTHSRSQNKMKCSLWCDIKDACESCRAMTSIVCHRCECLLVEWMV